MRRAVASLVPLAAARPAPLAPRPAVQRRWNILPDGRTYHPSGQKLAALSLPMNERMETEFNQLAKTAHQTQNLRDAVSLYDRVLQYRREKHGRLDLTCAATLHNLGRVFVDLRDHKSGEVALTEAVAIYEMKEGTDSLKYADSMGLLALCYRDMGLREDSEESFKKALSVYRDSTFNHRDGSWLPTSRVVPPQPNLHPLASVAHLLADCSVLFLQMNALDRAASFLEDALEIRRFLYSGSSKFKPMIAQTLSKLSEVRRSMGDVAAAELAVDECLSLCLETMGRDNPATAAAQSSKGNVHAVKQQWREAKKCYEEAATTYALCFGKESPLVASELIHIGRMQELLGEFDNAEKSFRKCIDLTKQTLGDDHVQNADACGFLAGLLVKKTHYDAAIPMLRDAIRIRKRINPNDPALIFVYHKLGDALAAKGDSEAEAHFLMALELHRQHNNQEQTLMMTDCLDDLGLHYVHFRHYDKAEEAFKEALDIRLRVLGDNQSTVGYSYSNMAVLYCAREEFDRAIETCDLALGIYDKLTTSDTWLAQADVLTTKGQALLGTKQFRDSRDCHERALSMRRQRGDIAQIAAAESLNYLAKAHLALGDTPQAGQCLAEAYQTCEQFPSATVTLRLELDKTRDEFPRASTPPPQHIES